MLDTMMNQFNLERHEEYVKNVKQISYGQRHALILINYKEKDLLFSVGSNAHGELGLGHTKNVPTNFCYIRTDTERIPEINKISAGFAHSAYLKDNKVYTWGDHQRGKLGHGASETEYYSSSYP